MIKACLFLISWFGFLGAQPDISVWACLFTSSLGYGLFFLSSLDLSYKFAARAAFLWFFFAELYHFSWAISDAYVGTLIVIPWILLSCFLSLLFVVFVLFLKSLTGKCRPVTTIVVGSLFWVVLEKIRYFGWFSGLSFDFTGWSLTANPYSNQFLSFSGTFGLTFAVMLSSLIFYFLCRNPSRLLLFTWIGFALIPYVTGGLYHCRHLSKAAGNQEFISVALIQTSLDPYVLSGVPLWDHILFLCSRISGKPDLIVFPEVVIPFGVDAYSCSQSDFLNIIRKHFAVLPIDSQTLNPEIVNRDWINSITAYFNCDVLIGTESFIQDPKGFRSFNSAVLFSPEKGAVAFYDKRILVPIGEYIPGGTPVVRFMQEYLPQYFSPYFKSPGMRSGVLHSEGNPPFGVTICYEETFGDLIRPYKIQGAKFLVNLTNDVWYPRSRLPEIHFLQGILRNTELGIPCVRSCNTGVTAGVDSLGRIVSSLPCENRTSFSEPAVLTVSLPLYSYWTPYSQFGDLPLTSFALAATFFIPILLFSPHPYCQKGGNKLN